MDRSQIIRQERLSGLDAGKFIAVCGVPFIHVVHVTPANDALDFAFRFAVPFFFIASGFFLAQSRAPKAQAIARVARRLGVPFIVWFFVYAITSRDTLSTSSIGPKALIGMFVNGGPGHHLWFLPALGVASVLMILMRDLQLTVIAAAATCLMVFGLLAGAYSEPIFGGEGRQVLVRNGVIFGFPFVAAGFCIAKTGRTAPLWLAATLFVGGGLLQGAEAVLLRQAGFNVRIDLLVGTVLFGLGAFLLALRFPFSQIRTCLAGLGRYSLGIYALHLLGLWAAYTLFPVQTFGATICAVLVSLIFAITISVALSRVPYLRALVR